MDFRLTEAAKPKRVAILASKDDHCLLDLLWRNRRGELDMSVVMVISNHPDLAEQVRPFGVPFLHVPAGRTSAPRPSSAHARAAARQRRPRRARPLHADPHRRVSSTQVGCPLINIHHSFLPAFIGAAPYRRAKERGVKLVGATAHYVTDDLDEGPIIEQDVVRVDHRARRRRSARASAPTSSAPCSPARCCGTAKTASSGTATRRLRKVYLTCR